jgi:uracil-DNA glycosylase
MLVKVAQEHCVEEQEYNFNKDSKLIDMLFGFESEGWTEEFEKRKPELKAILKTIDKKIRGKTYYPLPRDVFRCFRETNLNDVKVVIWGQDPYPSEKIDGLPRAQGMSFSAAKDDDIPGSLKTIFSEIKDNYPQFEPPEDGDLTYLARQGVLFLNFSLTYLPSDPKGCLNVWQRFIFLIINILDERINNCIHVLWGRKAEKVKGMTKSSNVIVGAHPSPLSAFLFRGNRHFIIINDILRKQNKYQINFNRDESLEPTFVKTGMFKREIN